MYSSTSNNTYQSRKSAANPNRIFVFFGLQAALAIVFFLGFNHAVQAQEDESARATLNKTLEAHGGIDLWRSYSTYAYHVPDFPLGANAPMVFDHTADLNHRRHLMVSDEYRLGFSDSVAWAVNPEKAGIPARFVTVGNSYFAMMPFVFADSGITLSDEGVVTWRDKRYRTIGVRYSANVGDSSDDAYTLYIDPETNRLSHIVFTVTYKAIRGDTPVNEVASKAMFFHEWQEAQGLLVPAKVSLNAWNNGDVQGTGSVYHITKASFSNKVFPVAHFEAPVNAVIDNSHE